jgi:regulator of protease activity HflC (stomatin/prohibitin superfamily)
MSNSTSTTANAPSNSLEKVFANQLITRDEYRAVRALVNDASRQALAALPMKELLAQRNRLRELYATANSSVRTIDGVKKVVVPVLVFQYIPSAEQKNKRWAYRNALVETIAFCDRLMAERNNIVSPLLTAERAQADAAPVSPEPVEVGAGEPEAVSPLLGSDDLPE